MIFSGKNTVCCHALLQGIFPIQGSNLRLLPCRQILHCLRHQGSSLRAEEPHRILGEKWLFFCHSHIHSFSIEVTENSSLLRIECTGIGYRSHISKIWVSVQISHPHWEGMVGWMPNDWKVRIFTKGVINCVRFCWHGWGVTEGLSNMRDIVTLMQTFSLVTIGLKENPGRELETPSEDNALICWPFVIIPSELQRVIL